MTFRAAPVIISSEHSFDTPGLWEIGCILKIRELYLFDYDLLVNMAVIDHNVVRFNIYRRLVVHPDCVKSQIAWLT